MQRLFRRQTLVERHEPETQRDVRVGDQQQAGGGIAVAAGAADLLVVGLDRFGQRVVHDEPDVGAVDAHAERVRRRDHVDVAGLEQAVRLGALLAGHAGVVVRGTPAERAHRLGDGLGVATRARVDDGAASTATRRAEPLLQRRRDVFVFRLRSARLFDRELEVAAGEAAQHLPRLRHAQALDDLAPDGGRGRRRAGDEAARAEPIDEIAELEVIGTEVVAPVADAVRLVDRDERYRQAHQHLFDEALRCQPLRRDVEQLEIAGERAFFAATVLIGRQVRRQVGRGDAARVERLHLVGHQRDERRDDERDAVEFDGGLLEAETLAAARRRDDEDASGAVHQLVDDLALPVVQLHQAPPFGSIGVHLRFPSAVSVM